MRLMAFSSQPQASASWSSVMDHGKFPINKRVAPVGLSAVFVFGAAGAGGAAAGAGTAAGASSASFRRFFFFSFFLSFSPFLFLSFLMTSFTAPSPPTMQKATLLWFDFFFDFFFFFRSFFAPASASIAAVLASAVLSSAAAHCCWLRFWRHSGASRPHF